MIDIVSTLEKSPMLAIGASYAAGVLTSFTPCVYPLIPVTVGIVGANAGSRLKGFILSLLYVLGMSLTYTVLGIAAAIGGRVFGLASHNPWLNIVVGTVMVLLGLSMLDKLKLGLPSLNIDFSVFGRGPVGVIMMGLVSGLVAAPCTTPVLGSILSFVTVSRSLFMGGMLLFAYGFGCGTLLLAAGTFAGFAANLPKSGGWMMMVKKVFGVVILASALYFFYMAFKAF